MYILNTLLSFPTLKKHKNVSMTSRLMTFNHYLSLPLAIPLPFGDGKGIGMRMRMGLHHNFQRVSKQVLLEDM